MSSSVLQRIASGDSAAVRECIDQYGPLVWSIARRLSRTPADAEDAAQEVFLDIWRSASRFDASQGSDKVFIAMIARRQADRSAAQDQRRTADGSCRDLGNGRLGDPGTACETSIEAEQADTRAGGTAAGTEASAGVGVIAWLEPVGNCGSVEHAAGAR